MDNVATTRRYDLDWLRVFVILMLIPFHAAVIFDPGGEFFLKNLPGSPGLAAFTDLLGAWGMQLLFFVAGASSWFMLRKSGWKQFITRRVARLLVPLVASMLTVIPVMGYYGYRFRFTDPISFWQYYPKFFRFNGSDITGYAGHLSPGHLWFILFLFVLLLVALPIFRWFMGDRGQRVTRRIASFLAKPGALFIVPIILWMLDGAPDLADRNIVTFFILLILGFIWMSDSKLQERVDRQRKFYFSLAVISAIAWTMLQAWGERQNGPSLGASAFDLLHDLYLWTAILAFMGLGHSFLNLPSRAIRYLGPASYPIYIIHLPVVIAVGYYAIQWDMAIWLKFTLIVLISFPAVFLVYDILIRRVRFIGRVFGGM